MPTNIVRLNPEYFPSSTIGRPLSNADIYVGTVDLDPEIPANQKQISVQQEDGTIVPIAQPISTGAGGVPLYLGSPVTILVDGNYSLKVLDSGGSQIYYVPDSLAIVSVEAENVDYNQGDTGAVDRTAEEKFQERISILDFGAVAGGIIDNSAALQACIDAQPTDIVTRIYVPGGTYAIASEVHIDRPVLFDCEGRGENTTLAGTSGDLGVTFLWTGGGAGIMFTYAAQTSALMTAGVTTGTLVVGGGIVGACLNGNDLATTGAWIASTINTTWDVQVRKFTDRGLLVDGGNGALSTRNTFDVNFVYGSAAAVQGMHGIQFRELNGYPSTQNKIKRLWGLTYDGYGCECADTDNNVFWHIHMPELGSGGSINFANGVTNPGRNNLVVYNNGNVNAESNTRGNRILHMNSESAQLAAAAGAQIHYDVIDYATAEVFETFRYVMSDEISVDANAMRPDGTVATAGQGVANLWGGILYPDTTTGYAQFNIPAPARWNDGTVTGVDLLYISLSANTSATAVFQIRLETATNLAGTGVPDADQNFTVTIADAQNTMRRQNLLFVSPPSILKGDTILCRVDRLPADASDTAVGNILLVGAIVKYTSDGPNSVGSGTYDVTPPFV